MSGVKHIDSGDYFNGTTPSGGLASGDVVFDGMDRAGIITAQSGFAEGQKYAAQTCGRVDVPAKSTDTFSAGDLGYWDATNNELTSTSSGNKVMGKVDVDKASGETRAIVLLNSHGKSA